MPNNSFFQQYSVMFGSDQLGIDHSSTSSRCPIDDVLESFGFSSLQDIYKDYRLSSVMESSLSTTEFINYFGVAMMPLGKALYDSQSESLQVVFLDLVKNAQTRSDWHHSFAGLLMLKVALLKIERDDQVSQRAHDASMS